MIGEGYELAWTWEQFWALRGRTGKDAGLDCVCRECRRPLSVVVCGHEPTLSLVCHACTDVIVEFRIERGTPPATPPGGAQ